MSIFNDWYGLVKKKSYDIAATTAVSAPLQRVPTAAPNTTTSTNTSTTLALARSSRKGTSSPATRSGPNAAIVSPMARDMSSGAGVRRAMTPVYACARRSDIHAASRFAHAASRTHQGPSGGAGRGRTTGTWQTSGCSDGVGFFALCVGFVWGCDRIIGPDESS